MNTMYKKKKAREEAEAKRERANKLNQFEKSVIQEVSEAEENNTTQNKIGNFFI